MWEQHKKLIIGIVIVLALLNCVAVYYKVIMPKLNQQPQQQPAPTSPFQQPHGASSFNSDNGQMSLLPRTQPFVTAPSNTYGAYEQTNESRYPIQDYSSWSVDWERSRENN